jgi:hypothetical protein
MPRLLGFSIRVFATVLLAALAVAIALSGYFYSLISLTVFPWLAFLGCTIVQVRFRFRLIDLSTSMAFAAICLSVLFLVWKLPFHYSFLGALLGMGSLLVMSLRAVWSIADESAGYLACVIPSLLLVGSEWLTPPMLEWGQSRNPKTLDVYLLIFDGTLHFQPSFLMGQWFEKLFLLRHLSVCVYFALPLLIALVYVEQLRLSRKRAFVTLLIFFFGAVIGDAFYNFYPACGPIGLLGRQFPNLEFPFARISSIVLEQVPIRGARNAMPSMHMAWVILACWLSENLSRWVKAICLFFLIFTFTATLGTGEHYFIDLVVALPFSLCLYALFAMDLAPFNRARRSAFLVGALGTAFWLILLRYDIPLFIRVPGLSGGLILATATLVFYSERRLSRARYSTVAQLQTASTRL